VRLRVRRKSPQGFDWAFLRYFLGRVLQVTGLVIGLVAATAFFGTPDTTAMLRMLLVSVAFFVPGWVLSRRDPRAGGGGR
jgi:hypothetical protein